MVVITEIEKAPVAEVLDFDPRVGEEHVDVEPVEELEAVLLSLEDATSSLRIGKNLTDETK